jgi:8-amino-7-oxononanoate synthase
MAAIGAIPALVSKGDAIFSDALNHACLIDGIRLSKADIHTYPHGDLIALESQLQKSTSKNKLIVSDTVFSMDGDIALIPKLLVLCEKYDAYLYLDDAHGFGVLGEEGKGSLSHFKVAYSPRIIYMGTLGKAAGVFGAFIAGSEDVIEWLVQKARSYVFTTAAPPMLAEAIITSIRLIKDEDWRRQRIQQLITQLQQGMKALDWTLLKSNTPIQPIIVGDNHAVMKLNDALLAEDIWVSAIRPPTVPANTARLRISLSASHTESDVERLVKTLKKLSYS